MITIGIVSWNTKRLLQSLLDSLTKMRFDFPTEIVVVDNASQDGSAEMVKNRYKEVKLIRNCENKGFTLACNQIIDMMKGEMILLINTDIIVDKNAIEKIYRFMREHEEAGACGCEILNKKGEIEASARSTHTFLNIFLEEFGICRYIRKLVRNTVWWKRVKEVDFVMGAFMILKKEAIENVGKFDEDYFLYVQEVDWCYRAKKLGWRIYFYPFVSVIHYGGESTKQVVNQMLPKMYEERYIFFGKHFGEKRAIVFLWIIYVVANLKLSLWYLPAHFLGNFRVKSNSWKYVIDRVYHLLNDEK